MRQKKSIAKEIEELRKMKVSDLVGRYKEAFGKEPRIKHREFLWKRISWKRQEQRYGGLSAIAKRKLEALIKELDLPFDDQKRTVSGQLKKAFRPGDPKPGTILTRIWKGQDIQVKVLDNGFEWEGVVFKSLSATAKAITGSHWNGRLFFGLYKRGKKNV